MGLVQDRRPASGASGSQDAARATRGDQRRRQLREMDYESGAAALAPDQETEAPEETQSFGPGDPRGNIAELHPSLQGKARALIDEAHKRGLDIWVYEGMRTIERQDALYAQGRTEPGNKVTWVQGGGSYHNYGLAIDVVFHGGAPWGEEHDWDKLGEAGEAAGLQWGGRWKNADRPHFQMPDLAIRDLKGWFATGGMDNVWANVAGGGGGGEAEVAEDYEESSSTPTDGASYAVQSGDTLAKIAGRFLGDSARWREIAEANDISNPRALRVGQTLAIPGETTTSDTPASEAEPAAAPEPTEADADQATSAAEREGEEATATSETDDPLKVARGQITFDAEGNDRADSAYFSRKLHHPGSWSGVTLGRGYDMKLRTADEVREHLVKAGFDEATAGTLSGGAGLKGEAASNFVQDHGDIVITHDQQKALFEFVYGEKADYAAGRLRAWTGTDWAALSGSMQEMVVDLFYRGDLTKSKWLAHDMASIVTGNDFEGFKRLLEDRSLWGNVDTNRYTARIEAMEAAAEGGAGTEQAGATQAAGASSPEQDGGGAAADVSTDEAGAKVRITASALNVRSTAVAAGSSNRLGALRRGTVVDVQGRAANGWYIIEYEGETAYMSGSPDYSEVVSSPEPATSGTASASAGASAASAAASAAVAAGASAATEATPAAASTPEAEAPNAGGGTTSAAGILDAAALADAQSFYASNANRYPEELMVEIQAKVGAAASGKADDATIQGIATCQKERGLTVDGKAGAGTLTELFGGDVRMRPDAGPSDLVDHDGLEGIWKESVKLTALIAEGWTALQPYLPSGAVLTSGLRSWADSARIMEHYYKRKIPQIVEKGMMTRSQAQKVITDKDYQTMYDWVWSTRNGLTQYKVAMPGRSLHCSGKAFDISGAGLGAIAEAVQRAAAEDETFGQLYKSLIREDGNNCVHINMV